MWEDVVEQVPFPVRAWTGGFERYSSSNARCSPNLIFSVQEQVAEGDKVASRFEWTGTHRGNIPGRPGHRTFCAGVGIVIDRPEKCRIKDTRIIMDIFGLMIQFALLFHPAPDHGFSTPPTLYYSEPCAAALQIG